MSSASVPSRGSPQNRDVKLRAAADEQEKEAWKAIKQLRKDSSGANGSGAAGVRSAGCLAWVPKFWGAKANSAPSHVAANSTFKARVKAFQTELAAAHERAEDMRSPAQRRREEEVAAENPLLCCPLSKRLMKEPVTATDGFTYDRASIVQWWKYCGETISPLSSPPGIRVEQKLIPTKALEYAIQNQIKMKEMHEKKSSATQSNGQAHQDGDGNPASSYSVASGASVASLSSVTNVIT
eukprot:Tamp_25896.p1 GENE.Tamp_25896~~Tamp_25896.p1  ORF type:complete len:239 (-),score=39.92 Tamp_25896:77-793(-)